MMMMMMGVAVKVGAMATKRVGRPALLLLPVTVPSVEGGPGSVASVPPSPCGCWPRMTRTAAAPCGTVGICTPTSCPAPASLE